MSYAIIRTAGFQFRAEPGKTLRIPSLDAEVGSTVTFEEVLLGSDGTNVHAGVPLSSTSPAGSGSSGTTASRWSSRRFITRW